MKKIDLTIFLEVKVVLKTHKYCFLKTFLNGLVSQILNNNNRFYLKLCEFLSRRRYRKCIFQIRLYAIKFQTAVNFSKLSTMRIKAALKEFRIIPALSGREYESVFRKYIFFNSSFRFEKC